MLHKSFKLEVRSASSLVMRASTGIVTTTSPSSIVLDACNPLPVSGNTPGFSGGELENPNPFNQLWRLRYTGSLLRERKVSKICFECNVFPPSFVSLIITTDAQVPNIDYFINLSFSFAASSPHSN